MKIDFTCGYECCPYRKIKPGKKSQNARCRSGWGMAATTESERGRAVVAAIELLRVCRIRREATRPRRRVGAYAAVLLPTTHRASDYRRAPERE